MEIKLKPCPFCGGKGRVRNYGKKYRIVCQECGAASHCAYVQDWHDTKIVAQCQAAKAWNVRHETPNAPLTLEELMEMDGKPVWVVGVSAINDFKGHWDICEWDGNKGVAFPYCWEVPDMDLLGVSWFAYRRKPKEEHHGEE